MIVEPPKKLEDFEKVLETILELMGNPYCDHLMFMGLIEKRDTTIKRIEELKADRIS